MRSLDPSYKMITLGQKDSTIPRLKGRAVKTVLPPVPWHLISQSSVMRKFVLCEARNSLKQRIKEWPKINTWAGGILSV